MAENILTKWEQYLNIVIPKDAPEIQARETKKAFLCGAYSLYELISNATDEEGEKIISHMIEANELECRRIISEATRKQMPR